MSERNLIEETAAPVVSVIKRWERDFSQTKTDGIIYDYIIVGSGTAGSVLANRLSEDENKRVLLIEAGGVDTHDCIHIPASCGDCQGGEIDWKYKTVPQVHSHFACHNQESHWPRGKVLGGCSSINYMQYVRGDPRDYDRWNLPGWSFEQLLPYFKKLERIDCDAIPPNEKFRNADQNQGMMDVTILQDCNPINQLFAQACVNCGFRQTNDYNAEENLNEIVGMAQISTKNGKRWSTVSGYLLTGIKRENLEILIHAHVCRVVFNDHKQVTGVIVRRDKSMDKEELIQGREVILSAGTIGSAQILLLSGIGPRDQLEKHQIPLVADLPAVGKNLQDHLTTILFYLSKLPTLSLEDFLAPENLERWSKEGKGPLTSCIAEAQAWFQVKKDKNEVPDIQIQFCPMSFTRELFHEMNFKDEIYEEYIKDLSDEYKWGVLCPLVLLHPKSKGEIILASSNPLEHPIINPNYLQEKEDVQKLARACQVLEKIFQTEPLKSITTRTSLGKPGDENEDQFWESFVRKYTVTVYHPTGTCRMGNEDDPMAVVTPDTRVKGVHNLRVVDASIIPTTISGNPNTPIIAMAERAADIIKKKI